MRHARYLAAIALIIGSTGAAHAQSASGTLDGPGLGGTPILFPSSSSSYNQQGFNLPTAPTANGQDIVRGAGGISCQSAIGNGGPTLDLGVIGTNDIYDRDAAALYGRVTIPLGKRPKRVDCSRLFELEVSRLQLELELMRAAQVAQMREAAQPVIFDDAAPPPSFSLGAIANPAAAPAPEPQGFMLVRPSDAPPQERRAPHGVAAVHTPSDTAPVPGKVSPKASKPVVSKASHAIQIAAYGSADAANRGYDALMDRLDLPDGSMMEIVPKRVGAKEFHTVRVVGLSPLQAEAVCATLDGACLRL